MSASDLEEIEQKLTQLISYVHDCRDRIDNDDLVDMAALDEQVEELCLAAESAPEEDKSGAATMIAEMVSVLEQLAESIKAYQQRTQGTPPPQGE